MIKNKNKNYKQ